jgi:hypothetical protein
MKFSKSVLTMSVMSIVITGFLVFNVINTETVSAQSNIKFASVESEQAPIVDDSHCSGDMQAMMREHHPDGKGQEECLKMMEVSSSSV